MKPNEYVLTILQVAAPIVAFSFGIPWLGWFLVAWLCFFGVVEWQAKVRSGKTLSQWVWTLPKWQRVVISLVMVSGMGALAFHFIWGLKEEPKQ
jgi:hypothetical protein